MNDTGCEVTRRRGGTSSRGMVEGTSYGERKRRTRRRDKEREKESEKRTDRRKVERLFMRLSRVWSRVLDLRGGWTSG